MKICDLCNRKIGEVKNLREIFILNNKNIFNEKDCCNDCYDLLPDNIIEFYFKYYPFARCLNNELAERALETSIFWNNFPPPSEWGRPWADLDFERSCEKTEKDRKKIKKSHISKAKQQLKEILNLTEIKEYQLIKKYSTNKKLINSSIWHYGWISFNEVEHRFDLRKYNVLYRIEIYLYPTEKPEQVKKIALRELSLLQDKVVNMLFYIKCEELNQYYNVHWAPKIKEVKRLDKEHEKSFNSTLKKIQNRNENKH